jgi:predicted PurR-regulated permease PerM
VANPNPSRPSLPVEIGSTVAGWVVGQIKVAAICAVLYAIGFALARVPWWPVVAIVCGMLHLVPIVGGVIALLIAVGAGYLGSPQGYIWIGALATYLVVQVLESFVLTPRILGRRLQMHPLAVLVAGIAGGLLFGPLGIVFAAPVLAIALIVWRRQREGRITT